MGSTTHKEQWMTDIDEFMEQLSPIPAFDVTDLIGRLTELGEQYGQRKKSIHLTDTGRAGRLIKPLNTYSKPTAVFIWRSLKRNNEPNRLIRTNTQSRRFPQKSIRPFSGLKTSAHPCRRKPTPIGSQARVTVTGLYWRKTSCA